jgi:hypothetical protein
MEYQSEEICRRRLYEVLRLWAIKLYRDGYSLCISCINFVVQCWILRGKSAPDRFDTNEILVRHELTFNETPPTVEAVNFLLTSGGKCKVDVKGKTYEPRGFAR